jgi:hypothetical protein
MYVVVSVCHPQQTAASSIPGFCSLKALKLSISTIHEATTSPLSPLERPTRPKLRPEGVQRSSIDRIISNTSGLSYPTWRTET